MERGSQDAGAVRDVVRGPLDLRPGYPGVVETTIDISDGSSILNHMVQYTQALDSAFAALSDPTRRGILEYLGRGDASISDLATHFDMTPTGMKKHVGILEQSALVKTEKVGRVRTCRLGTRRLDKETAWIARYQQMLEARFNRLEAFLDRTKGRP